MSLLKSLSSSIPFVGRQKGGLPRAEMLALRPVRNPSITWEPKTAEDDEETPVGVALRVPHRDDWTSRLLARFFGMPPRKTIELDEFGAGVWERCDGKHTIEQLVRHTCDAYKLNQRQAEVSIVRFMQMLAQRRLIGTLTGETRKEDSHASATRPRRGKRRPGQPRRR
ncbi:MAG: PqqD family protein [Armatimonadota bacterium]|nr:PqqD family protein [Armatimonadota bacterium]